MKHDLFNQMSRQMVPDDKTVDLLLQTLKDRRKEPTTKKGWIAGAFAAAFILLVAPAIMMLPAITGKQEYSLKHPNSSADISSNVIHSSEIVSTDAVQLLPWEEREIYEQYTLIKLDDTSYSSVFYDDKMVSEEKIDNFLCKATAVGYDECDGDYMRKYGRMKEHQTTVDVYSLKSINKECFVAVKYPGHEEYYAFQARYTPQSFGQLMDDFGLEENLDIEGIFYKAMSYTVPDQNAFIWRFLSEIRSAECIDPIIANRLRGGELGIKISMSFLESAQKQSGKAEEDMDLYFGISKNGYLITNLCGSLQAFKIGQEKAAAFIDDVLENGNSKKVQ